MRLITKEAQKQSILHEILVPLCCTSQKKNRKHFDLVLTGQLCTDQSLITVGIRGLVLALLMFGFFPCYIITLHKYFWCSRFSEFHGKYFIKFQFCELTGYEHFEGVL